MTPAARIAAAIEVLADIADRRRPAGDALKDWGLSHRFAGSGDRAAIAGLTYDALRRKASSAYVMGAETPRAIVLGMLARERDLSVDAIARLADGSRHAPEPLTDDERARLAANGIIGAPAWIVGDYPQWLDSYMEKTFGPDRAEEGAALAGRAPLDLRVNTLKADRDTTAAALAHLGATPTRWSPVGLRIVRQHDAKSPAVQVEPAFLKGQIEVQDEGSQLAALLTGAKPGEQVVDLCAGAGGKTLALSAQMDNQGQIYATDFDKRRLAPIHARLDRAGAHNVQVRTPKLNREVTDDTNAGTDADVLGDLQGHMDLVLIDAPCTGTGVWRRNPDAKWRMRPGALEQRNKEQALVLDRAAGLVKPGGRLAYVTCSVLDPENGEQVRGFLARHPEFAVRPPSDVLGALGERAFLFRKAVIATAEGLLLTPRQTDTDGFFVSVMTRVS